MLQTNNNYTGMSQNIWTLLMKPTINQFFFLILCVQIKAHVCCLYRNVSPVLVSSLDTAIRQYDLHTPARELLKQDTGVVIYRNITEQKHL